MYLKQDCQHLKKATRMFIELRKFGLIVKVLGLQRVGTQWCGDREKGSDSSAKEVFLKERSLEFCLRSRLLCVR